MTSEWEEIRRDFPGLAGATYLNAAATSLTPRVVRETVDGFYRELEAAGDARWDGWVARREEVRRRVARFIGAEPDEIAFVPNTSTGMNLIADLVAPDGAVVSDELEFPAVTIPFIHRGVPVTFVPAVDGVVPPSAFVGGAPDRAATIAISHVQFSNGCRQDLARFGALKGARNLVVSASQSLGALPVDVHASGVDALASAGHKWLCAGYGAGLCYVSRALIRTRAPHAAGWMSGKDPFAFDNRRIRLLESNARTELGCPSFATIFALGAAVAYLDGIGIPRIARRVLQLNEYLTSALRGSDFEVLSPGGEHRSGQTLVRVEDPRAAYAYLSGRDVHVTRKPDGLRVSTHFYNDEADVDRCVLALKGWRETYRA